MDTLIVVAGCILVVAITFAVRVGVIWKHRHRGCDAYYFLFCSEEFRKHKKLPIILPKVYVLEDQEQYYPPGFSVLLALIPQRLLERYYWVVSPAIDCFNIMALYIVTYVALGNVVFSILAGVFFAVNASSITDCTSLNSRAMGALLFSLTMVCLIGFVAIGGIHLFILAMAFGFVLLLSHKLSSQLLYVVLPAMSIIFWDWVYIVGLVAIIFVAAVLSKGMMVRVWKGQKDILEFWRRNWRDLGAHQIYSSPMYRHLSDMDTGKIYKGGLKGLYKLSTYLGLNIFVVLLIYPLLNYGWLSVFDKQMLVWALLVYFVAVLVMFIPSLRFLGEGYRYLKLSALPVCYLAVLPFAWGIGYHSYIVGGIVALMSVVLLWKLFMFMSRSSGTTIPFLDVGLSAAIKFLKDNERVKMIMCISDGVGDAVGYYTRKKVLRGTHNVPFKWAEVFFPVYKLPLDYLIKAYSVTHIVVFTRYISVDVIGLLPEQRVFSEGQYEVYEV